MNRSFHWSRSVGVTAACCLACAFAMSTSAEATAAPADADIAAPKLAGTALDEELSAELDSYVQSALGDFEVPGAAVALLQNGAVVYRGAFGVRGERHPGPVNPRTLFMIGSVTKSMTATMIATLVDDGVLQWDAPVRQYLPSFALSVPEYSERVTLRQLLSHQSGVSRHDMELFLDEERPLALIRDIATMPVHSAPGQSFEYQNQAFTLSGFMAARAAGADYGSASLYATYERLMQRRVFDAVGMPQTTIDFERAMRSSNHAWPNEYSPLSASVTAVEPSFERFATTVAPSGAVWSNLDEMTNYALMQLSEGQNRFGRRVVSEAALEETHTQMTPGADGGYGLGWGVAETPSGTIIEHAGGTAGFGCDVLLAPDADFGVIVLTNRASSTHFVQAVETYALQVLFGAPRSDDSELLAAELAGRAQLADLVALTAPANASDARTYLGDYERDVSVLLRGPELVIKTGLGELQARPAPSFPGAYLVVGNVLAGSVALFSSDESGQPVLTIGIPDTSSGDVNLLQPVTLEKRSHHVRRPHIGFDPRREWRRAMQHFRERGLRLHHRKESSDETYSARLAPHFERALL
jgi:CubicO group peptidase (beta-lactamase class C family)